MEKKSLSVWILSKASLTLFFLLEEISVMELEGIFLTITIIIVN